MTTRPSTVVDSSLICPYMLCCSALVHGQTSEGVVGMRQALLVVVEFTLSQLGGKQHGAMRKADKGFRLYWEPPKA
jgi:hypothetical protein